jgi:universal stress protein E
LAAVHARFLAKSLNAELVLVSCVFDSTVAFELGRGESSAIGAQTGIIENERAMLENLAQSLRDWGARVGTHVVWERLVYQGVLREVRNRQADLLVLGAHEPKPVLHTRLTDTDWQLMRLCPCPLLVVKSPVFEGYRTILAAIDPLHGHAEPSGLDRAVLAAAREIAHAFEAQLCVAHASPDPARFAVVSSVEVLPGVFYGTENIESLHRKAVQELASEYGVGAALIDVRPGEPVEVIANVVRERRVELVVLGALKRSRLAQAMLGSTAESVVAEVACDALLVPPPPPAG